MAETPTRWRALRMLLAGRTQADAARACGVTRQAVSVALARLRRQWGCETMTELLAEARARGITPEGPPAASDHEPDAEPAAPGDTTGVRGLQKLVKRLGLKQTELAERIGKRPDDVSQFFGAVRPGGLMDQIVAAIVEVAKTADCVDIDVTSAAGWCIPTSDRPEHNRGRQDPHDKQGRGR